MQRRAVGITPFGVRRNRFSKNDHAKSKDGDESDAAKLHRTSANLF
jgi:hypothetical protein